MMTVEDRILLDEIRSAGFVPFAYPAHGDPDKCCVAVRVERGSLWRLKSGKRRRGGRGGVVVYWPNVPAPEHLRFNDFGLPHEEEQ